MESCVERGYSLGGLNPLVLLWSLLGPTEEITKRQNMETTTKNGFPSGIIRFSWNNTEHISTAPAQGGHAQNREV